MRQLEFNLTPRAEHHGSIEPWLYRFEKGTLLEEIDSRRYVYGLWDKMFGCWEIDTESHASREFVPSWVPLNSRGIWRDHLEIRFENAPKDGWLLSPKWRYEANAAFAGLFSSIPGRIRSVVAPLARYQWLALDMIWQVPEFVHFLDEEIFNGTQQYVFACLALSKANRLSRSKRRELAKAIMTSKRSQLLSQLSTVPCTKKTIRLLYKLGNRPCSPNTYQTLIEFACHDPCSKSLQHISHIEPHALGLIGEFPKGFLTENLTRIIFEAPDDCQMLSVIDDYEVGSGFRTTVDIFPEMSSRWKERISRSLRTVRNFDALPGWGERWAQRLTEIIQFPSPPFTAIHHLIPLATPRAVRQEAKEMRNCVSRLIGSILTGHAYFYSWDGHEPATVLIEHTNDSGWQLSQAYGYNNDELSVETHDRIKHVVALALANRVGPDRS
jgi:hypothetical protein